MTTKMTMAALALIGLSVCWGPLAAQENAMSTERARAIRREMLELQNQARGRVLQARGVTTAPRPAINAVYNLDDFPPVTIRFVRFTISLAADNAEPCIDELEIFGPDAKENLARAKGVKAAASSLLPGYDIHQIAHLNDGKYGNSHSWISNEHNGGWAQIEFPADTTVSRVVWSRDSEVPSKYSDRQPIQYRLEVSKDGEYWKTVSSDAGRPRTDRWFSQRNLVDALDEGERQRYRELAAELKKLGVSDQ